MVYLRAYPSVCLSVCLSSCLFSCLFARGTAYFAFPSVHLSVSLSSSMSSLLFHCQSIFLSVFLLPLLVQISALCFYYLSGCLVLSLYFTICMSLYISFSFTLCTCISFFSLIPYISCPFHFIPAYLSQLCVYLQYQPPDHNTSLFTFLFLPIIYSPSFLP